MIENKLASNAKPTMFWLFKMAWRDGFASRKKLGLFMASIVLGIAAVVSIQLFGFTLEENIAVQSKSLMGADFKMDGNHAPNEEVLKIIDSLGGANAREISFSSMAAFPESGATKLVQVRGIDSGFPFYGSIETTPQEAAEHYHKNNGALVDATLLLQLNLAVGDSIKIGSVTLPISGALKSISGSNAIFSSIAPPVVIPYHEIENTGLVQTGSRIRYDFYFVANPSIKLDALEDALNDVLQTHDYNLDTHTSTSERMGRRYANFGKFLNLVAFIALILGCIGIASAIQIYIKEKLQTIAVLKCLGTTKRQTFLIFLIQISAIGFVGGCLGTSLGVALQQLFPLFLSDLLPVDVAIMIAPKVIVLGVILGVIMSILFALYPLIGTLYISPLQALRINDGENTASRKAAILMFLLIFSFLFLFALWILKDWHYALFFVLGVGILFSILTIFAKGFMKLIKRNFPKYWSYISRQSLLNLYRPNNQTVLLIVVIGIGSFLISTLYFTQTQLVAQTSIDNTSGKANLILLDVQTPQTKEIIAKIVGNGLPVVDNIPIVTMRIESINGVSVNTIRKDSVSGVKRWILNHEFRVTYRDSLVSSEEIVEGKWIPETENREVIPISVSDNFAQDAKVVLGDVIQFNVQGMPVQTKIESIRRVDWTQMQMNFSVLFPKGILENAPQFQVLTTNAPNEEASAKLQQEVVRDFANISIIDLRQIGVVIEKLLLKITLLINFMAFFSILTAVIVLLGAVRNSKFQRIKENIILRTLGASSKQILKIVALEYLFLGILGSLFGVVLSFLGSILLAKFVFESPFVMTFVPLGIVFPAIALLVLIVGLANSLKIISTPPLEILRKQ